MDAFYYYYPDGSAHKTIPTRGNYSLCPIYHQYICYIFFGEWSQLNRTLCYPRVKTKCGLKYDKVGLKMVAVIAFVFICLFFKMYVSIFLGHVLLIGYVRMSASEFCILISFWKKGNEKKVSSEKVDWFPPLPLLLLLGFFSFFHSRKDLQSHTKKLESNAN